MFVHYTRALETVLILANRACTSEPTDTKTTEQEKQHGKNALNFSLSVRIVVTINYAIRSSHSHIHANAALHSHN